MAKSVVEPKIRLQGISDPVAYLTGLLETMSYIEIAQQLELNASSLQNYCNRLGIVNKRRERYAVKAPTKKKTNWHKPNRELDDSDDPKHHCFTCDTSKSVYCFSTANKKICDKCRIGLQRKNC